MVKYLLENKSKTSVNKKIALIFAAMNERGICCQILLQHNANPREEDKNKLTAYDYSRRKENPLAELILGSSSIPQGSTVDEIIVSLNEILEREREKVYSEIQYFNINISDDFDGSTAEDQLTVLGVYDDRDNKRLCNLLIDLLLIERRMKRFLKLLKLRQAELQSELNSRNSIKEVAQLQENLLKLFNDQYQRSSKTIESAQKDLFTADGIDILYNWNDNVKSKNESLAFAIDPYSVLLDKTLNLDSEITKKLEHIDNFILNFKHLIIDPSTKLMINNSDSEVLLNQLENQAKQNCDFK